MFNRKIPDEETFSAEFLSKELDDCRERKEFLAVAVRALACYLKDFSFDLADIDADDYKKNIDEMVKSIVSNDSVGRIERKLDRDYREIATFVTKKKRYFDDRESELKNLIELLGKGLSDLIGENREFGHKISQGNIRLEQIVNIDDIRRVKESLRVEIDQMRDVVREKQTRDEKLMNNLEKQVDVLRDDLERVHKVAITDPLTGANNRYSFDTHLHNCVERNLIEWKNFSILLCDLDNFKAINDTYGHPVGDAALTAFVTECQHFLREDDYIARYGGDEFIILLKNANLRNAVKKAGAICQMLASKQHYFRGQDVNTPIRMSVSIGVAEAHRRDTMQTLIERADAALYQAKQAGRGRAASEREIKKAA